MDTTEALRTVENSLRDFLSIVLKTKLGNNWINQCGVSEDRIRKWKERKEEEAKRLHGSAIEERLIYFADFYDLTTIIQKHWDGEISQALGDLTTIKVFLKILEGYRNPDAHRRGLLPHQEHLVKGISGEIRNRLVFYRSKKETGDDVFPRLESVRDNYMNTWTAGEPGRKETGITLRPGDYIDFIVDATDPLGSKLSYKINTETEWQASNHLILPITAKHISKNFEVFIFIKTNRDYHAMTDFDDGIIFEYKVLPNRSI